VTPTTIVSFIVVYSNLAISLGFSELTAYMSYRTLCNERRILWLSVKSAALGPCKDMMGLGWVFCLVGGGVNCVSAGLKGDVIDVAEATTKNVVGLWMISESCMMAASETDYGFVVSQFRSRMRPLTFRKRWSLVGTTPNPNLEL
jgi:hypothetical protein